MEGEITLTKPVTVWTIGHGTLPAERFQELLRNHGIAVLADIRRFPTSRWPRFKQENLHPALETDHIEYLHVPELGGYRGDYLAHTRTVEFRRGLDRIVTLAEDRRTAIMCAESVFFRCHRRFVADRLAAEGHTVFHIFPDGRARRHGLRGPAQADRGRTPALGAHTTVDDSFAD